MSEQVAVNNPCEQISNKKNKMTIVCASSALAIGGASAIYSYYQKNSWLKTLGFFAGGVAVSAIPLVPLYRSVVNKDKNLINQCELEKAKEGKNRRYTVTFV
jgi:hypothetical protein